MAATEDLPLDELPPLADDGESFEEPIVIAPMSDLASLDDTLFDDGDERLASEDATSWLGDLGGVDVGDDAPVREEAESGYLDDAPAELAIDVGVDEGAALPSDGGAEGLDDAPRPRVGDEDAVQLPPLAVGTSDDVGVD